MPMVLSSLCFCCLDRNSFVAVLALIGSHAVQSLDVSVYAGLHDVCRKAPARERSVIGVDLYRYITESILALGNGVDVEYIEAVR